MISGSVRLWHWLESLLTLEQVGYRDWLGAEIPPQRIDPVAAFGANVHMLRRMMTLLEHIGAERLAEMVRQDGKTAGVCHPLGKSLAT